MIKQTNQQTNAEYHVHPFFKTISFRKNQLLKKIVICFYFLFSLCYVCYVVEFWWVFLKNNITVILHVCFTFIEKGLSKTFKIFFETYQRNIELNNYGLFHGFLRTILYFIVVNIVHVSLFFKIAVFSIQKVDDRLLWLNFDPNQFMHSLSIYLWIINK